MLKEPRSGTKEEVKEKEPSEIKSLCVNCKYNKDCNYRIQSQENIIFCEEYEIGGEISIKTSNKKEPKKSKTTVNKKLRFNGLCINCSNRFNCTHPKPEGGVWHCEDYM
jgi:hypothetical protein